MEGPLCVEHRAGGERVVRLAADLDELGRSLIVAHSGKSHFSADKNWRIIRRRLDGDAKTFERFDAIARVASELSAALERGDLRSVGFLMMQEWTWRRQLVEGVSTERIEALLAAATGAGAWGGKACGAGGGGCIVVLAPVSSRAAVESALRDQSADVLTTRPTARMLEVDAW